MKSTIMILILTIIFTFLMIKPANAVIDLKQLEEDLKTTGVVGYIHGTDADNSLFVFTYRNPKDFFDNTQLPITSELASVNSEIKKLKRHQKVKIFGSFADTGAPLNHLNVTQIETITDYSSELDQKPAYEYKNTKENIVSQTEMVGRVHAIDQGGKVLVVEFKDRILPVFVKRQIDLDVAKSLSRGDKIALKYFVRKDPESPIHLSPDNKISTQPSIELLEDIKTIHGKNLSQEGYLIKFPKSPQILFDVYAVLKEDSEGSQIQYTLVNFENTELFTKLREKLDKLWQSDTTQVENMRNKLVNKKIRIKATGIGNYVSAGQANPQILIQKLEDVQAL